MDMRVRIIIELVSEQPNRDFSLEELARHVELSTCHLDHLFSKSVGHPCMQYIILCRLELASQLLRDTFLSVKQISRNAGWKDQNYFHRYFKRRFRMTPLQYRRIHQEKMPKTEQIAKMSSK